MTSTASTTTATPSSSRSFAFPAIPPGFDGTVYSYIRFSSAAQAAGTSIARQTKYATEFAAEYGLKLDTTLTDKALSAFTGKHLSEGEFGAFVLAIEKGLVKRGSILVVESIDRLSRQKPMDAQSLLTRILKGGVMIVTQGNRQWYTWESVNNDMGQMIMLTAECCRAHSESKWKSSRKFETVTIQCKAWVAGDRNRRPLLGQDPSWVEVDRAGTTLIEARKEAIRSAVTLYLGGHGPAAIVQKLNDAGVSMTANGNSIPHVEKTLRNRALIGEKAVTVRQRLDDDEFAEVDYVLEDYYPPVLTLPEWHELQDSRNERGRRPSKGLLVHVLTGVRVARCGHCGSVMFANTQRIKAADGSIRPRAVVLRCMGRRRIDARMDCPGYKATPAFLIERAVVRHCSDLMSLQSLYGEDRTAEPRARAAATRERCEHLAKEIDGVRRLMLKAEVAGNPTEDFEKMRGELVVEHRAAAKLQAEAERELNASKRTDLSEVAQAWADVQDGVEKHEPDARLLARQLVADTFKLIAVFPGGANPNETLPSGMVDILLLANGGVARGMRMNKHGEWSVIEDIRDWRTTPEQPRV